MIELAKVTKRYGSATALDGVSLRIPNQGIYSLLGRNGAGKTTMMKLIAGHTDATGGRITVGGQAVSPEHMPRSVNFIESGAMQFNMPVSALIAAAADFQEDFDREFALEMTDRFELNAKKKFKQLSFGMKTMLTVIITLANNADVMLLDEPTMGFDAIMRDQFNTLLLESYQAHPRTIIVSTHLIDEIARVTERLVIIDKGRILMETGMEDIDEKAYTLSGPAQLVEPLIQGLRCIGKTTAGSLMAAHIYGNRIVPPEGVSIDRMSLQDFFVQLVGGKNHEK